MFRFTFQYGSIQIDLEVSGSMKIPDLHSNMVLFKFLPSHILFYLCKFTFQYGSIQITKVCTTKVCITNLHSNMVLFKSEIQLVWVKTQSFTFQYGSIQITYEEYMFVDNKIYIPIWFYSNPEVMANAFATANLHSNMVLFK